MCDRQAHLKCLYLQNGFEMLLVLKCPNSSPCMHAVKSSQSPAQSARLGTKCHEIASSSAAKAHTLAVAHHHALCKTRKMKCALRHLPKLLCRGLGWTVQDQRSDMSRCCLEHAGASKAFWDKCRVEAKLHCRAPPAR